MGLVDRVRYGVAPSFLVERCYRPKNGRHLARLAGPFDSGHEWRLSARGAPAEGATIEDEPREPGLILQEVRRKRKTTPEKRTERECVEMAYTVGAGPEASIGADQRRLAFPVD